MSAVSSVSSPRSPHVLVADDHADVVEALSMLIRNAGYRVATAGSPAAVLSTLERSDVEAVLLDLNYARDTTSGREGLDLLAQLQAIDATLPVVVMTAWGSVEGAVEAMRRGARDYVQKPWDDERLLAVLRTQIELATALRTSRRLEGEASRRRAKDLPALIAGAPAMQPVLRLMERIAPSDANVLVTGEHGTGKEVVARWIHAASPRAARPFVAVDSGGMNAGVFESELFGHVKGAFTDAKDDRAGCLELAEGGTLFLDEIGNMPAAQQVKLLRVVQNGEYHAVGSSKLRRANVRFLAATNVDLAKEVAQGRFREDLLYRLNTVEIRLPSLRERREDIPLLASHFARSLGVRYGRPARGFSSDAMKLLRDHAWPGNVRELEHAIERAHWLAQGDVFQKDDLALRASDARGRQGIDDMTLEEVERHLIERALGRTSGNVTDAANLLGLSRSALYRRLQQYGLRGSE
jgi:DNA-binding NtrC family response regulator